MYAFMAHVTFLYGNDEMEFSKRLNFVEPQLIAFARALVGKAGWSRRTGSFSAQDSHMDLSIRGSARPSDGFVGGSVDGRLVAFHSCAVLWNGHRDSSFDAKRRGINAKQFLLCLGVWLFSPSVPNACDHTSSLR